MLAPVTTLYDISIPLETGMIAWPGDPGVSLERALDLAQGDPATVSRLTLGSHSGTHVDAFSHFKPNGKPLDRMDLNVYVGPARVMAIRDPARVTAAELAEHDWQDVTRVLFKTANSQKRWHQEPFDPDFVHLAPDAADFLVEKNVRLVGIDTLSIDGYRATGAPCHHRLMDHGVYLVEGLLLQEVPPGDYELICLPLNLRNADGAPARVILRGL